MDEATNTLINRFIDFLTTQLLENKEFIKFKDAQIVHWSLKDNKVTVELFFANNRYKIFYDLRELKDNQNHFLHLLEYTLSRLKEELPVAP